MKISPFKAILFDMGFEIKRSFCGGGGLLYGNFDVEWQWCLILHYRTPWTSVGGWNNWRCQRYFYFGARHPQTPGDDLAPGFKEYMKEVNVFLTEKTDRNRHA